MGYIRFVLSTRRIDDAGNAVQAVISRLDSDMADTAMLETGLIMHARRMWRQGNRYSGLRA